MNAYQHKFAEYESHDVFDLADQIGTDKTIDQLTLVMEVLQEQALQHISQVLDAESRNDASKAFTYQSKIAGLNTEFNRLHQYCLMLEESE